MKIRGSNTEVIFKWLRSFLFQSLFIIIYQKKEKLYTIMIKTMIVDLAFLAAICRSISSLSVTILFYDVNFNCFWCSLCKKILHHKKIIIWTWIVAEIQDMGQFWKFSQDNIIPDMQKKLRLLRMNQNFLSLLHNHLSNFFIMIQPFNFIPKNFENGNIQIFQFLEILNFVGENEI